MALDSRRGSKCLIILGLLIFLLISFNYLPAQSSSNTYEPSPENLKNRQWLQDAKFGLFVHWGIYSILGDGEWVMNNQGIPVKTYEKLASFFYPVYFNPAEWVSLAKKAGMKYIVITSRHHDGFSMFDTKASDYNMVKATPYGRDILKMLADECRKEGLKLGFYYSLLDWHHPDYFPRGATGHRTGRPNQGNWENYIKFMKTQLRELLTNYGEVLSIWLDGYWDRREANWHLEEIYNLIHSLQPGTLVGNNHHQKPFPGEDFQMFEKDLPGHSTKAFNIGQEVSTLPLEMCETINRSWGFNLQDRRYKSPRELIHLLIKAAGYNTNLLLNVGPMPNGRIQPEFVKRLEAIGQWLKKYGESIYGTRGGPISPREWGVTTQKGKTVYVHILNYQDKVLFLPGFSSQVRQATLFPTGTKIRFRQLKEGLLLHLSGITFNEIDTIIKIQLK
jgi:alpha-L-fucosidase